MDIKNLIGTTITITDIEIDSDGDITIIGNTPTQIKTIHYENGQHSYPIHDIIKITFIAHDTSYTRCGDLDERGHIEAYYDESTWDEEENDYD